MSMHKAALLAITLGTTMAFADDVPRLGEELTAEQLADIDYTVLPDGDGLPGGSGTASAGEALYATHCLACHGMKGKDGINDRLAGGLGSIHSPAPVKTVGSYWPYATTVFDYIRRAMPFQSPGSLTNDEVYSLTAYLLYLNEIVDMESEMNAETLPGVVMPNAGNFVWAVDTE